MFAQTNDVKKEMPICIFRKKKLTSYSKSLIQEVLVRKKVVLRITYWDAKSSDKLYFQEKLIHLLKIDTRVLKGYFSKKFILNRKNMIAVEKVFVPHRSYYNILKSNDSSSFKNDRSFEMINLRHLEKKEVGLEWNSLNSKWIRFLGVNLVMTCISFRCPGLNLLASRKLINFHTKQENEFRQKIHFKCFGRGTEYTRGTGQGVPKRKRNSRFDFCFLHFL